MEVDHHRDQNGKDDSNRNDKVEGLATVHNDVSEEPLWGWNASAVKSFELLPDEEATYQGVKSDRPRVGIVYGGVTCCVHPSPSDIDGPCNAPQEDNGPEEPKATREI